MEEEIDKIVQEKMASDALDILFSANIGEKSDDDSHEAIPEHANLLNNITSMLQSEHGIGAIWTLTGISCSEHSLQLAVNDAIGTLPETHKNIIKLARHVAKHLRLQTTSNELNSVKLRFKVPRLDVETRWGSTYMMVCVNYALPSDFFQN